jgi:hypothetical protein
MMHQILFLFPNLLLQIYLSLLLLEQCNNQIVLAVNILKNKQKLYLVYYLEDLSEAPNDGKAWNKEDSKKLLEMNTAGITLIGMAKTFGRTKLAIGWRLADQAKLNKIG